MRPCLFAMRHAPQTVVFFLSPQPIAPLVLAAMTNKSLRLFSSTAPSHKTLKWCLCFSLMLSACNLLPPFCACQHRSRYALMALAYKMRHSFNPVLCAMAMAELRFSHVRLRGSKNEASGIKPKQQGSRLDLLVRSKDKGLIKADVT